jgi:hypothetical protein
MTSPYPKFKVNYSLRYRFAGDDDYKFLDTHEWIRDYITRELEDHRYAPDLSTPYYNYLIADDLYYIYSHASIKRSNKLEKRPLRDLLSKSYGITYVKYEGHFHYHISPISVKKVIGTYQEIDLDDCIIYTKRN